MHLLQQSILSTFFLTVLLCASSCSVVKTNYDNQNFKEGHVYYYLPESQLKITSTVKVEIAYNVDEEDKANLNTVTNKNIVSQTFSVSNELISDTKTLLTLNYTPNALASDEVKFQVNEKGLLEIVNVSTEDRTADIVAKLAEAPQIILTGSAASKGQKTKTMIKEFSSDFLVKASKIAAAADAGLDVTWKIVPTNELDAQLTTGMPLEAGFNLKIETNDRSSVTPQGITAILNSSNNSNAKDKPSVEINGLLTRPLRSIELQVNPLSQGLSGKNLPINIAVPDMSKAINIPLKRSAFVKRTNNLTIKDGVVLSNEIRKPSSIEGFVSIPINIAKAIVAVPGQLVSFRFDNTNRNTQLEEALLKKEKAILDSEAFALQRQVDLDKAKLELEKHNQAKEIETEKYKLELELSLIKAQTEQLEASRKLDELKKELDELKKKNKAN